jgi:PPM family protein phosphatase
VIRVAEHVARTDTGRQRATNEDSYLERSPVFVVADGMGGAQAGEVASRLAVAHFAQDLAAEDGEGARERLVQAAQDANAEIFALSEADARRAGMGTTLTAAYVGTREVFIAHVGDSRAYRWRDVELARITEDHSLVEELLRQGRLTVEEAEEHPQRSIITRALGPEPSVAVDTWNYPLRPGDVVMLCSDGLTDMLPEQQVRDALFETSSLDEAADRLIADANAAGGRDNITVVLFRVELAAESETVEQPTEIRLAGPDDPGSGAAVPDPGADRLAAARSEPPVAPPPVRLRRARLARIQGWSKPQMPKGWVQPAPQERHFGKLGKFVAGTVAVLAVVFIVGGGGYLATRQLYFIGTNYQGTVVVYRGLPYVLPFGIPMYETFYVSGVPAQTIPPDVRASFLNHSIRSQSAATKLINDLELGKITG